MSIQRVKFEELEKLKALPPTVDIAGSPDGDYAIHKAAQIMITSTGPDIVSQIWFTTPALDLKTIERIESLQLFAQSHDQGWVTDEKEGNWTWFELVILENPEAATPRVKDGVQLVWRSHYNRLAQANYDWAVGELFPDTHDLFGHLEDGNAVGIRVCSRFSDWELWAKDGFLVVELVDESKIGPREAIDYKPLKDNVKQIQEAFNAVNAVLKPTFSPPEVPRFVRADSFEGGKPIRVLALDGGGVRGISSLHLLKEVLKDVPNKDPWQIFDLIAGTSTGGLIAIMLGRLKMSIDECITRYEEFSHTVFGGGKSKWRWTWYGEFYDHQILENVIKEVVGKKLGNENALLLEEGKPDCKVMVTAIAADSPNNRAPVYLRNYQREDREGQLLGIKIWEAARATSAAPNYFVPIVLENYRFIDGGLGANNPVGWLWNEVLAVYGPKQETACCLSIGTGIPHNVALGEIKLRKPYNTDYIEELASIATNTQLTHVLFHALIDSYAPAPGVRKYWRLNLGEDPAELKKEISTKDYPQLGDLDDVGGMQDMINRTIAYMNEPANKVLIEDCGKTIKASLPDDSEKVVA